MALRFFVRVTLTGLAILLAVSVATPAPAASPGTAPLPNPILFVTQVPIPADFVTIGSVFGNHRPALQAAGRGGDLYILYPDGSLRNLTAEAGYGSSGQQGAGAIAVRQPAVHWDGTKAVFSMVVGAPTQQYQVLEYHWQLYEVTGLGQGQTAQITKVPNQPLYNNVSPIYGSDDRILFTSDRPRGGEPHLYPQHDEYESTATNTGLWSLDPATGDLILLDHAPSGNFTPILDSFGRVIFTRWDHLQRDQQADADALNGDIYGTFDFASEAADAPRLPRQEEVFPEPRSSRIDLLAGTNLEGHRFNHFFPWMVNEDGRELETLNHIGRHELHGYFNRVFNDDPNLEEFIASVSGRYNSNEIENLLQMREDPTQAGRYFGIDAPEFQTHSGGQIVSLESPPSQPADAVAVTYVTHRDTRSVTPDGGTPAANHSGFYRNPLPLADGSLIAVHTAETRADDNEGTRAAPQSRYDFRLKRVVAAGAYSQAATPLTSGISKTLSYWDPDVLVSYSGPLWELDPVEIRVRPRPTQPTVELPSPELTVFTEESVDPLTFEEFLRNEGLALIVSRDVTTRDEADLQQPFNLRVPGGTAQTTATGGTRYDVSFLQIFQGDQIRGIGGIASPRAGRRVLARPLHDPAAANPLLPAGPPGSVAVGPDGSVAALVPARRALSWQLTDGQGTPVVRERYWLTFQPGEMRVCASCHGLNSQDQVGQGVPSQPPEALRQLLRQWLFSLQVLFTDGFENGDLATWTGAATGGGDLAVTPAAALAGSFGLEAVIDDTDRLFVERALGQPEDRFAISFRFDPNSLVMPEGKRFKLLTLFADAPRRRLATLVLRYTEGEYRVLAKVHRDDLSWAKTGWVPLADQPQELRLDWRRATADGHLDGFLRLWVDGVEHRAEGVDNDQRAADFLRLGPLGGLDAGTVGSVYLDAVHLSRASYALP